MEDALRHHVAWQRRLLDRATVNASAAADYRFLVLRPADRWTVCTSDHLATGQCMSQASPKLLPRNLRPEQHWDDFLLAQQPTRGRRLLPGLGNIACSLASAAVVAVLSRRILLVENWTSASSSFAAPLPDLLVGPSSAWAPFLLAAQRRSRLETFVSSDSTTTAARLCADHWGNSPPHAVWRIVYHVGSEPDILPHALC
jgi:hypothetical protein